MLAVLQGDPPCQKGWRQGSKRVMLSIGDRLCTKTMEPDTFSLNTDFRTHEIHRSEYFALQNLIQTLSNVKPCAVKSQSFGFLSHQYLSVVEACVAKYILKIVVFCFGNGYFASSLYIHRIIHHCLYSRHLHQD